MKIDTRLVARNTALNVGGQAVTLAAALAAIPLVVRGLGAERFGIFAFAWMVVSYFGDLGFGRATTKFVAEVLGRGERHRVAAVAWATIAVQGALGLLGALALAAAAPLLAGRVLRLSPELVGEATTAFVLTAALVPLVMLASSLRGVLEGAQRFGVVNAVRVPSSVANSLLPLLGLALGWGLEGILWLILASRVATVGAFGVAAVRLFPELRRRPAVERGELRRLAEYGGWVTVSSVVSPMLAYLDRFLLGALVAMSAVGYYTAPYELVTRLWILPAGLFATLFPAFSTLGGQAGWAEIRELEKRAVRALAVFIAPAVLAVLLAAGPILEVGFGAEYAERSTPALRILALGMLVNSLAFVPLSLLQGLGRADVPAKLHLLELPVQLVLAWVLVRTWGITGAAAAWSLRVALDAGLLFVAARRVRGRPFLFSSGRSGHRPVTGPGGLEPAAAPGAGRGLPHGLCAWDDSTAESAK